MTGAELVSHAVASLALLGALWGFVAWPGARPRVADHAIGAIVGAILGALSGLFLALFVAVVVWLAEWPARW